MAVMGDAERKTVWAEFMQELSKDGESIGLTKAQLRAAIDAADQWASDNAANFNAALPTAARNSLSTPQKARLLMVVVGRRWKVGV